MPTIVLKDEWVREAESWSTDGDPAYDDTLDVTVEMSKISEKNQMLAIVEHELEVELGKLLQELIGVNPFAIAASGAGVALTGREIYNKILEKHGKAAADEFRDNVLKSIYVHPTPPDHMSKVPRWKKFKKLLAKRLGLVGAIAAGLGAISAWIAWKERNTEQRLYR